MESTQKIDPVDWMVADEIKAVMAALQDGDEPQALFVGGCVRNTLLNKEVEDVDIATLLTPELVTKKCEAAGFKVVPTGIDHGTVTAVINKKHFEITTLRKDVETFGRHATVAFSQDWAEDAARRDFTMNALLMDPEGNIFDPAGQGLEDLHRRRIRFVGDPAQRIAEDYLRILRFFRFHAIYGDGEMDPSALAACKDAADQISTLSIERVSQEVFKLLSADDPVSVLEAMFENGILPQLNREKDQTLPTLFKLCKTQKEMGMGYLPSRLFVLAGLSEDNIGDMQKTLLFPKVFLKDIAAISKVLTMGFLDSEHIIKEAVYRHGRTASAQALLIQAAQGHFEQNYLTQPLETIITWKVPTFPITGEDLMAQGFEQGPALGQKLDEIEEWWISQSFKPDKKSCLKQATP